MAEHRDRRLFVCGSSGNGKTHFLRAFVAAYPRDRDVWVIDFVGSRNPLRANFADVRVLHPRATVIEPDGLDVCDEDGSYRSWLDEVCDDAIALGNVCVVVDEVDKAARTKMGPSLVNVCNRGAHYGVDWVFSTQRPQNCPRALDSEANEAIAFGMQGRLAAQAAADRLGLDDWRLIHELPRGQFFHSSPGLPPHHHTDLVTECRRKEERQ